MTENSWKNNTGLLMEFLLFLGCNLIVGIVIPACINYSCLKHFWLGRLYRLLYSSLCQYNSDLFHHRNQWIQSQFVLEYHPYLIFFYFGSYLRQK